VNPGIIDTPMTAAWPPETRERTVAATPLARMGTAEEVAATVVWLASDAAAFVQGAHVDVNGGLYMS
jgi:NAD(P)-dependent dehydrogenase (short-subunit alcohol dehydrogenase family)